MSRRATIINFEHRSMEICAGEPMLDTSDGVLIIQFDDGTSRTFNWDYVTDFYYMTEDEFESFRQEADDE